MDNINERFIELRKACKKNQTEWGKILGITRSGIAQIETGQRKVTEKHLIMLSNWDEYNVNIEWLRTGEGEMFLSTETDVLEKIRQDYHLTERQFKFVSMFLRLPEDEKEVIFHFLESVFGEDGADPADAASGELSIDERVEDYRRQLELEESTRERSSASFGELKKA